MAENRIINSKNDGNILQDSDSDDGGNMVSGSEAKGGISQRIRSRTVSLTLGEWKATGTSAVLVLAAIAITYFVVKLYSK